MRLEPCLRSAAGLGAHQHAQGAGHSQASAGHGLSSTRQQASRQGWARGGEEAALEKSKEWGAAAAVYCSQPWVAQVGTAGGFTPLHLDAPALPLLFPVPSPWVRLLWAGRSELCWPSLSLLSPSPGTILALPRWWAALRSFKKGDREMLTGRREGARWDLRKTGSASPRGRTGVPRCSFRENKVPAQRSPSRGSPLPSSQPGSSSEGPGEGSGAVAKLREALLASTGAGSNFSRHS